MSWMEMDWVWCLDVGMEGWNGYSVRLGYRMVIRCSFRLFL